MNPLELMRARVPVLFRLDETGDLVGLNERGGAPAPLVYAARTAVAGIAALCFRQDVGRAAREAVHAALAHAATGDGRALAEALHAALAADTAATRVWSGPVFVLPPPLVAPVGAIQLYPGNAGLLHPDLATFGPELPHRKPAFAVFRDRCAVSVCYSARANAAGAEAGVETSPRYRGMGCAMLAVEAWAAAIHEGGRQPFYSTSWENSASLAVARKLGLEQVGEDVWVG